MEPQASVTTRNLVIEKLWEAVVQIKAGEPRTVGAVAPQPDAGFVKVAEIAITPNVGIGNSSAITDTREIFSIAQVPTATGIHAYDKIVGDVIGGGVTHTTLLSALEEAAVGDHILVLNNQISSHSGTSDIPTVQVNNISIEFKNGTYVRSGGFDRAVEAVGIIVNAPDCTIRNMTAVDFTGTSITDAGIIIRDRAKRAIIENLKYFNCDQGVSDFSQEAYINVQLELESSPVV